MGYPTHQRDSEFFIAKEDLPKGFELICEYCHDFEEMKNLQKTLKAVGWYLVIHRDNAIDLRFDGEQYSGDEIPLFYSLAPVVRAGSFIEMAGEDGELWRWNFDGEKCTEKKPRIIWD